MSHAKYLVRLGSTDGTMPPANHCTQKGMVVSKPYSAYFMFYSDAEGVSKLAEEKVEWERMIAEYTPEKLAAAEKEKKNAVEKEKKESAAAVQGEAEKPAVKEAQPVAEEEAQSVAEEEAQPVVEEEAEPVV